MTTADSTTSTPIPLSYDTASAVVYATFGQRFSVIDSFVLSALQLVGFAAVGGVGLLLEKSGIAADTAEAITGFGALGMFMVIAWAYYALMEASRWQATLGKRAVGIEVADIEGGYATWVQTSVRFVLRFVSGLILGMGYLLCLLTRRHQTLHDIGANCEVVKEMP